MSNKRPPFYALLVGINEYINHAELPTLGGCVNDVDEMERLLRDIYHVPKSRIRKLTNSQATHAAIKQAFHKHLVSAAQKWANAGKKDPAPAFLFHYSGHGAQAIDETGTEPDGLDETIVPHDSRTEGVYDIKDWELDQLITELTQHSDNVTVILDCCHSGSGTRGQNTLPTRRGPPDLRPQPTHRPPVAGGVRGVSGPSDWVAGGHHVLLAGCRDQELANEYIPRDSDRRQHGVLTYFLLEELRQPRERPMLYSELHERVRSTVNAIYKDQMPQCEGDLGREVFGGARPRREVFLNIEKRPDNSIWVGGGLAHGLTKGTQLQVYPAGTRTLDAAGAPIAMLEVQEIGAVNSRCATVGADAGAPATPAGDIPADALAVVYRVNYGATRRRIALEGQDAVLRQKLTQRLTDTSPGAVPLVASYVSLVEDGGVAEFRIVIAGDSIEILDAKGTLLVAPSPASDLDAVAADLAHLARYYNALEMRNTAPSSTLADAVSLSIKKLDFDPQSGNPRAIDFPKTDGGETVIQVGDLAVLQITNKGKRPLYVGLFDFSPNWEVALLYPNVVGAHEQLHPGKTISIGLSSDEAEQLAATLPEGMIEGRDVFKVIATVAETDFGRLEMGALKTPFETKSATRGAPMSILDALLDDAMNGGATRTFSAPRASVQNEWITSQTTVLTTQPIDSDQVAQPLEGGRSAKLAGYGLEVEPPAGFIGTLRVLTQQQTRGAGDDTTLQPPPGLAAFPDLFQPLELRATRGAGPSASVIEIEADAQSRQRITSTTPLQIRLGGATRAAVSADQAGVLALAYDGSYFYPVGRTGADADTVQVEWLPDPPEQAAPVGKRSISRLVKLYLFNVFKWPEPTLGLHSARFVPSARLANTPAEADERVQKLPSGEVRYRDVSAAALKPGQRIALVVHGFQSETWGIIDALSRSFAEHAIDYDHILAFDYESFNTHIRDNGKKLADLLRAAGFGPSDGWSLDVFAHSMGTLVTRSMVELEGGDQFVERVFLAGAPNFGTALARLKPFITWLLTLAINKAGPTPPALLASWVVKRVSNDAIGPMDLHPDSSQVIKDLKAVASQGRVPYFILAGSNVIPINDKSAWDRLTTTIFRGFDLALDVFFKDQNDTVIGLKSMLGLRDDYPQALLKDKVLPCDHHSYFNTSESLAQLRAWLTGG
jgi:hypothetical protein